MQKEMEEEEKNILSSTIEISQGIPESYNSLCSMLEENLLKGSTIASYATKGNGSKANFTILDKKELEGPLENEYFINHYREYIERLRIFRSVSNDLERDFREKVQIKFPENATLFQPNKQLLENYFVMRNSAGMYYLRLIKPLKKYDDNVITCHTRAFAFKHTNLLPLLGWCKKNNQLYYVYQYEAEVLDYYLERKATWTSEEVFDFVKHLIQGMAYLQERNVHYHSGIVFVRNNVPIIGFDLIFGNNKNQNLEEDKQNCEKDSKNLRQIVQKIKARCSLHQILDFFINLLENQDITLSKISFTNYL